MKRLLVSLILALSLAIPATAQVVEDPSGGGASSGSTVAGCSAITAILNVVSGTLTCNPASVVNGSVSTAGRSILTIKDTIVGDSINSNFLRVEGTLAGSPTAAQRAVYINVTGAGSANFNQAPFQVTFNAGYTGSFGTIALGAVNNSAGTGQSLAANANFGATITMSSVTTGYNVGSTNFANGSSVANWGVIGRTPNSGGSYNAGVVGYASGTGGSTNVGVFGILSNDTTVPASPISSAGLFDNSSTTSNILTSLDNGNVVQAVQDGGSLYSKIGTKALTLGGGAVTFVRVAVTSNSFQGGFIDWCADANDATDYQTRCGILPFSIVNKGGTETCTVGTPGTATESVAASAGTFTVAFTVDTATPANGCDFQANGTSSLTETVMRINYTVRLVGNAATAVTAQ